LVQFVLQAERQSLFEIVVWSLSFLGVGKSSNGDTLEDGLAIGSLGEDEGSWAVTDRRDGLLGVVELRSAYVTTDHCMSYLLNELGELLVDSQVHHRSVLHISTNSSDNGRVLTPPTTKIALKSLALTSLILIVSFQTFWAFLSSKKNLP
jgi:hypothetical protein